MIIYDLSKIVTYLSILLLVSLLAVGCVSYRTHKYVSEAYPEGNDELSRRDEVICAKTWLSSEDKSILDDLTEKMSKDIDKESNRVRLISFINDRLGECMKKRGWVYM